MIPSSLSSCPAGMVTTTGLACSFVFICSTHAQKFAPMRSSLFTYASRGTLYLVACRHTVSDCTSTPPLAQNTPTAPSSTRKLRSTSAVKSTWPGVSMMLMAMSLPAWSCQSMDTAALLMVMPFCRSSGSKSVVVSPSSTSPTLCLVPL